MSRPIPPSRRARRRPNRSAGFMLLEIVLGVGLLVAALAIIGSQVQRSYFLTRETDNVARVFYLAESRLAEIDTGLIEPAEEIEEDFGRLFPKYASRLFIEQVAADEESTDLRGFDTGLALITLEILHDPLRDIEEEFDFEEAEVVDRVYLLRAAPQPLNLVEDFGMPADAAERFNNDLAEAGLGGAIDLGDATEFNPTAFRDLDVDTLLQVIPILMQAFGADLAQALNLVPAEVRPILEQMMQDSGVDTDPNPDTGDNAGDRSGDNAGNTDGGTTKPDDPAPDQDAVTDPDDLTQQQLQDMLDEAERGTGPRGADRPRSGGRNTGGRGNRGGNRGGGRSGRGR